jgi:hypothetical protein
MVFPQTPLGLAVELDLGIEEGFESGTTKFGLSGTWARDNTQAYSGEWSLKSAAIGNSATTDAVVTVPSWAETVQFRYKVSSESGFDFFSFRIDASQQFTASGEVDWTLSAEYDVSSATTITFRYAKDSSDVDGSDAAWVDDVVFGPGWTDVTTYVHSRDGIQITRGRADETAKVERSTCRLSIDNRDGRFSPRNPTGEYFGRIGRNTPLRVLLTDLGDSHLAITGAGTQAKTSGSGGVSLSGDRDIRVDLAADSWFTEDGIHIAAKVTGGIADWGFGVVEGLLSFSWNDSVEGLTLVYSDATISASDGDRLVVRVTMDENNGAGAYTLKFYTGTSITGPWTQLGGDRVGSFVASMQATASGIDVGGFAGISRGLPGKYYQFQLRSSIDGTIVADAEFFNEPAGPVSFTDDQGNVWSGGIIRNSGGRFVGEVSAWPQRWDKSGTDVWVPIEAAGVLRRLSQGASPLRSVMFRHMNSLETQPVAYWPLEDESDSTQAASAIGGPSMRVNSGTPEFASSSVFVASADLVTLNNSVFHGRVPGYSGTGEIQVRWLVNIPSGGAPNGGILPRILCTGTAPRWDVVYGTGGTFALKAYDAPAGVAESVNILDTGALAFNANGKLLLMSVELVQNGANINYAIRSLEVGSSSATSFTGTLNSRTATRVTEVHVGNGSFDDVPVGHVSVEKDVTTLSLMASTIKAYAGETAGRRIERLCGEEGVNFQSIGDLDSTELMGFQTRDTLVNLLYEAAETDLGILFEPQDVFGLVYRTRETVQNQAPKLTLDYSAADLSSLEPTDDDQLTRNDVTVTRKGGSSARRVLESGPMSILEPPAGIGRYDDSVSLSLFFDSQATDQAGFRLHLGTVDEARYPVIDLELHRQNFVTDTAMRDAVLALDVGDRLVVENPPAWIPPEDISQIAQGFTEFLRNFELSMSINCSPESPWRVATYTEDTTGGNSNRFSSEFSALTATVNSSATSLSVATEIDPLWTVDDDEFPFDIMVGGERMTVTDITGASSPQTFTVTRSVNGVTKSQLAGTQVTLFIPAIYAL